MRSILSKRLRPVIQHGKDSFRTFHLSKIAKDMTIFSLGVFQHLETLSVVSFFSSQVYLLSRSIGKIVRKKKTRLKDGRFYRFSNHRKVKAIFFFAARCDLSFWSDLFSLLEEEPR